MTTQMATGRLGVRQYPVIATGAGEPDVFRFTRLRALTWFGNGLIFNQVQAATGKMLGSITEAGASDVPLIVNCQDVNKIDEYALEPLVRSIDKGGSRTVLFIQMRESFVKDLEVMAARLPHRKIDLAGGSIAAEFGERRYDGDSVASVAKASQILERSYIKRLVANSFVPNDNGQMYRLSSTPILASGAFNAQILSSDPVTFVWICLLLAACVDSITRGQRPANLCILTATLRSSLFAAAISELLEPKLPLSIVDHLGPRRSILEVDVPELDVNVAEYIYLCDYILLGSELKLAQSYADHRGFRLQHAVAIGQLLDDSDYSTNLGITVHSLVELRTCGANPKYSVF